ncbi:MAG: hypothetical protein EAY75_03950, partial [Bacteroidetes bacterium]
MSQSKSIPTQYTDIAFDYNALRQKALAFVQAHSGNLWTDHNVHDPGITIMEMLCFAITDLSYRATLPIANLLASAANTQALPKPLYSAATILPTRATTPLDYRKLCIDTSITRANGSFCGVKNAWLQKTTRPVIANLNQKTLSHTALPGNRTQSVSIKGFYNVLLEFDADATNAEKIELMAAVRQKLQQQRNLCEDFVNIAQVEQAPFRLCAEIDIAENADPFDVLSSVLVNLQQYLSPVVNFYSLEAMQEAGLESADIFDGPRLQHGFIKTTELLQST